MAEQKLLDQVRWAIRAKHYSIRTEKSYVSWIKRFIFFHNKKHPVDLKKSHVMEFVNSMVVRDHVSLSTRNQALCAVLFLYREVLQKQVDWIDDVQWSKKPYRLPVVFSVEEA